MSAPSKDYIADGQRPKRLEKKMALSDLAGWFHEESLNMVILRARQFLQESGTWSTTTYGQGSSTSRAGTSYGVAIEIQAVACQKLGSRGEEKLICLSLATSPSALRSSIPIKPMEFHTEICSGKRPVEKAWTKFCDSWVHVPAWLSPKPAIFSRQFHLNDEYTNVPITDLVFLRHMDVVSTMIAQHKSDLERCMYGFADRTPIGERGVVYKDILCRRQLEVSLLDTIGCRLRTFNDNQFSTLTNSLGIVQIEPITGPD